MQDFLAKNFHVQKSCSSCYLFTFFFSFNQNVTSYVTEQMFSSVTDLPVCLPFTGTFNVIRNFNGTFFRKFLMEIIVDRACVTQDWEDCGTLGIFWKTLSPATLKHSGIGPNLKSPPITARVVGRFCFGGLL